MVADSTTTLSYTPTVSGDPTEAVSIAFSIDDGSGVGRGIVSTPTWSATDETYYLTFTPSDVSAGDLWDEWTITWTWSYGGATYADTEYLYVVDSVCAELLDGGLVDIADMMRYLKRSDGITTSSDVVPMVSQLVNAASAAIRNHTSREFTSPTVAEARNEYAFDAGTVYPEELVSVTSIADDDGVTLTSASDYEVIPGKSSGDHVRWIELTSRYRGKLVVTGVWGWDALPAAVQQACRICVRLWYLRDAATFTTALDTATGFIERPRTIPTQAEAMLAPYVRKML
jgi:hypothetical protein